MKPWEGGGALMPPGFHGERRPRGRERFWSLDRAGAWVGVGIGKEGAESAAGVGSASRRAGGRGRRYESRNDRMQERGGERRINSQALSERLLCAKHSLGTGDTVRKRADPTMPLQDSV